MPIHRLDTINKAKTFPNTDNTDRSASLTEILTVILFSSVILGANSHPSATQAFRIRTEEKVNSSYCSTIYSEAGVVNVCIYRLGNLHTECLPLVFISIPLSLSFNLHLFTNQICFRNAPLHE